jgi:hypothetical protein
MDISLLIMNVMRLEILFDLLSLGVLIWCAIHTLVILQVRMQASSRPRSASYHNVRDIASSHGD